VHASVESRIGGVPGTHGIYRSGDNGQTYAPRITGLNYLDGQGWYDNTLWVDPSDVAIIVFGGIDLYRTVTGGTTPPTRISDWTKVSSSVHADHHAIVAEPGSRVRLWFGNDGGLYRTNNVLTVSETSGWLNMNNALGITQFYGGGVSPAGVVIGGTQDNTTIRHTGNTENWSRIGVKFNGVFSFTGDGGRCEGDRRSAAHFYGEHQFAEIFRSVDGGLTAVPIRNNLTDAGDQNNPLLTNFIAPMALDPSNSNRLYVGCDRLWTSGFVRAANPTWLAIKPSVGSHISAVAVAETNPLIVWVGHNNGQIYRSTGVAGPLVWNRVDNNIPGPHGRVCTDLLIDPANANRVYATFGGFANNNVWRTTDGGPNWVQITGGGGGQLPVIPVFSIALHRQAPGWLYAGTDLGVFISTDDGANWAVPTDGPANVPVYDLLWKGNRTLVAVTHGRGMYQADAGPPPAPPGRTARASVSSTGTQAGNHSDDPSISTDGRFVAFHSPASNLVPGDLNGATDVFVYDRQARDILLASWSSTGDQANNACTSPSMSGDGRYVAFESLATNLVPNGRPSGDDVYVRDLLTAQTYRESVSSTQQLGNGNSYRTAISADGRWVAFESVASNLVAGDGNGRPDVFLRDRLNQTTVRVSLSDSGMEANGASGLPAISADGRHVSFASDAPNLVQGDTNGVQDVFVRDVMAGNTFRVSVSSQGVEGNDRSGFSSVSADGRYVAFDSIATNLVPGDTNLWEDVFVHDRVTGQTRRITFSEVEAEANGPSSRPSISDDGQVVAFYTVASNLVPRDTNNQPDVLVADCVTGRITIASVSATGVQGNNASGGFGLALSGNGRSVAFSSAASNLVPGDNNGFRDVFVQDRFPAAQARGVARIGATLTLDLDSPDEPNQFYLMAASLSSSPGIPVDTRTFPLTASPFLVASLTMPAVFQGFTGNLDGAGHAEPRIVIPADRSLGGTTIFVAALTLRAGAPSGVWGISTPLAIRIFAP